MSGEKVTAEQIREALEAARAKVDTDCTCSECEPHRKASAILRRLLDSGFIEEAMAYQEVWLRDARNALHPAKVQNELALARQTFNDAFRRLVEGE